MGASESGPLRGCAWSALQILGPGPEMQQVGDAQLESTSSQIERTVRVVPLLVCALLRLAKRNRKLDRPHFQYASARLSGGSRSGRTGSCASNAPVGKGTVRSLTLRTHIDSGQVRLRK